ncbi:hypothetical protein GGS20DRAFT_578745 [Poronia punctata]|nr:hypothetical protein GGS20DRAFT_578745 [Poronia punctata]
MGAFVSIPECKSHYNATLDCSVMDDQRREFMFNNTWPDNVSIGGYTKGEFPADPDIAGIGILGVFIAVTSFALAASATTVFWQAAKTFKWTSRDPKAVEDKRRVSFTDIVETLVMTCSDQQLFTGAAYALTLRYLRGCTVSVYHYNIIANMLLLTCATHLMSVTIVRNYWKYPWLAIVRILSVTGVFIVTGLLFTNQNAAGMHFPTGVPDADQSNSLIFLPAACFQSDKNTATETFQDSVKDPNAFFVKTLQYSTPDNKIQGWNVYVLTLLYYGAALIAEGIRFVRRGRTRPGWRANLAKSAGRYCGLGTMQRRVVSLVFLLYLIIGVGISGAVVVISGSYIFDLRRWVDKSGWIREDNNQNPENDPTSFGQLVPILTSGLILFSFCQIISEKLTRRSTFKNRDEETLQGEQIQYLDPSNYDLLSPKPEKDTSTEYFGAAGVAASDSSPPQLELGQSYWGSTISLSNVRLDSTTPMLEAEPELEPEQDPGKKPSKPPNKGSGYMPLPTEPEPVQSTTASRVSLRTSSGSLGGSSRMLK